MSVTFNDAIKRSELMKKSKGVVMNLNIEDEGSYVIDTGAERSNISKDTFVDLLMEFIRHNIKYEVSVDALISVVSVPKFKDFLAKCDIYITTDPGSVEIKYRKE